MTASLLRILRLGVKELHSLRSDLVLMLLIVYTFTFAIYAVATGAKFDVENASVAIVDEDHSMLSSRLRDALLKPFFNQPVLIGASEVDPGMDAGRFVFVVEIPPKFEPDAIANKHPSVAIDIDATAMSQAGNGATYIQNIIHQEILAAIPGQAPTNPIDLVVRAKFNPNLKSDWFTSVMQIINNISILAVILAGAALIREREHGTIEHLLVMPIRPVEIMLAKIWANGLVIVTAATVSLLVVVERVLAVPVVGSLPLFVAAAVLYLFSVTALGILIATISTSMAQFGLIAMPLLVVMNLLSGSTTSLESMPFWLQQGMMVSPSTHFVAISQAILYRGAGLSIVWPQMLALFAIGVVFFGLALMRFRKVLIAMQ